MLKKLYLAALVTTMLTGTAFAKGSELFIQDFVETVKVENSVSDNISITRDKNMKGVNIVEQGDSLKIDGGIERPEGNKCKGYYGSFDIGFFKKNKSAGDLISPASSSCFINFSPTESISIAARETK